MSIVLFLDINKLGISSFIKKHLIQFVTADDFLIVLT